MSGSSSHHWSDARAAGATAAPSKPAATIANSTRLMVPAPFGPLCRPTWGPTARPQPPGRTITSDAAPHCRMRATTRKSGQPPPGRYERRMGALYYRAAGGAGVDLREPPPRSWQRQEKGALMATAAVGTSILRRDGPEKLTGQARYAGDLALPGLLHARLVLSPYASAKIERIDTAAAAKLPGVVAVYTADDLALKGSETGARRLNFLARDRVVFTGQPVAVVLGETEAQAADGAAAVEVGYEGQPAVADPIEGMSPDAPEVRELPAMGAEEAGMHAAVVTQEEEEREDLPANVTNSLHFHRGDVEQGLREADVVVEHT